MLPIKSLLTAVLAAFVLSPLQILPRVLFLLEIFPHTKHATYLCVTTMRCDSRILTQPCVLGTLKCPSGLVGSSSILLGTGVILASLRRCCKILQLRFLLSLNYLVMRLCCCLRPSLPSLLAVSPVERLVVPSFAGCVCCVDGLCSCVWVLVCSWLVF